MSIFCSVYFWWKCKMLEKEGRNGLRKPSPLNLRNNHQTLWIFLKFCWSNSGETILVIQSICLSTFYIFCAVSYSSLYDFIQRLQVKYGVFRNKQVNITSCVVFFFDKRVSKWMSEKLYFYFRLRVLKVSTALDEPGAVNWEVALCLLLAWIICYLCVFKGVKSTGKVRKLSACFLKCYEKAFKL